MIRLSKDTKMHDSCKFFYCPVCRDLYVAPKAHKSFYCCSSAHEQLLQEFAEKWEMTMPLAETEYQFYEHEEAA